MKVLVLFAALTASPAFADLEVRFIESAPKDTFRFTNTSACDLGPSQITVDLTESAAGLYFDTTSEGAGVEVFQPFELVSGKTRGEVRVRDGDTSLTMDLNGLAAGQTVAFTIDVDDSLAQGDFGQIRVSRAEIAGTSVILTQGDAKSVGVIRDTSRGNVTVVSCSS